MNRKTQGFRWLFSIGRLWTIVPILIFSSVGLFGQQYTFRTVVTNLDTPWEILWGPDNWIWVTERRGRVSRVNPETGEQQVLAEISEVAEVTESGLMGMALHPNFADSPFVYLVYTYRTQDGNLWNKVAVYEYTGDSLRYRATLLDSLYGWRIHDGARLWILPDRTLLITMGDAGVMQRSQQLDNLNGKVLRIRLDGTIPADNPFPDSPIYAYGLRNSQGLVVVGDRIYLSDHGPASDDEVNLILKGRNYGWPNVMGWCDDPDEQQFCQEHQVVEPMAAWTPTLAVCGLDYYNGPKFPEWQHSLLLVTLKAARLVQLKLNAAGDSIVQERHFFVKQFGRLRDLCISPDGRVFIATSNRDGRGRSPFPLPEDDRIIEILPAVNRKDEGRLDPPLRIWTQPQRLQIAVHHQSPSATLQVYDLYGRLLFERSFQGAQQFAIVLPAAGAYLCQLRDDRSIIATRWVVVW